MDKIKKFLASDLYTAILFIGACIVVFAGKEVFGTILFALIIALTMAMTDDLIPALQGVLFTVCFAIRCKHSFDEFIKYWYFAIPIAILFFTHFFRFRTKLSKGSCFWAIFAASAATTLGGAGIISAKEYFSPTSIFYVIMLGFGMLLIYCYLCSALKQREEYEFSDRFSKMMASIIPMLSVCLFQEYFSRREEFLEVLGIIPFQWRNNASTLLMLAMPFAFYLSAKFYGWFFAGILSYAAILFSGSRGGMIFGLAELILCIAIMIFIDKKHRKYSVITICICIAGVFLLKETLLDVIDYTIERLFDPGENSIRLGLIPRGIEDFLSNPLFGRGLGYMGNRDIHESAEYTLCWYHCSPIQVIGSFGIAGAAAYGFLVFKRIRLFIKNLTFFNIMVFASYIGIEMMSLVNPGVFAPFPYLFLVTAFFVIIENCNSEKDKSALSKIRKGQNE